MKLFIESFNIETIVERRYIFIYISISLYRDNFNFSIVNRKKFKTKLINGLFSDENFLISLFKKDKYMINISKGKCNSNKEDIIFPHISKKDFTKAKLLFPTVRNRNIQLVIKMKIKDTAMLSDLVPPTVSTGYD